MRAYNWLKNRPLSLIMLLFLLLCILNTLLLLLLFGSDPHAGDSVAGMSTTKKIVYGILIVPFVETLIFQCGVIELGRKFIKSILLILLISTVLFASSHLYSTYYFFAVLVPCFLLAAFYTIEREKRGVWSAILYTTILHGLVNTFATIWNYLDSQGNEFTGFFG